MTAEVTLGTLVEHGKGTLTHRALLRSKKRPPPRIHRLTVTLLEIEPLIWRTLQVPSAISLRQLHNALQAAMGWTNSHLHEFTANGRSFGRTEPRAEPMPHVLSDRSATLADIAADVGTSFNYNYDFGDDWNHQVTVDAVIPAGAAAHVVICLDGDRACPPEDCGGPHGYARLLEALADPDDEEHEEMQAWAGRLTPEIFDLAAANRRLAKIVV